jgi:hypothetical protein
MSNDESALNNLLSQIAEIEREARAIAVSSGNAFNVFDALEIQRSELHHSRLLAYLIDPAGNHGKGAVFLKAFLQIAGIGDFDCSDRNIKNITVKTEVQIPDNQETSGRIDIVIADAAHPEKPVFIENKIYAGDQPQQLQRYHKYKPKAHIIYLTLYGKVASDNSAGDVEYQKLSYANHIVRWLEDCQKWLAEGSSLWSALRQYVQIIKDLTGQGRRQEMENEVINAITKGTDSLRAFAQIWKLVKSDYDFERKITVNFLEKQFLPKMEELVQAEHLQVVPEKDFSAIWNENGWFVFFTATDDTQKKKWDYVQPCFWFAFVEGGFGYGFYKEGAEGPDSFDKQLAEKFVDFSFKNMDVGWFIGKKYYLNLTNPCELADLCSVCKGFLEKMLALLDG